MCASLKSLTMETFARRQRELTPRNDVTRKLPRAVYTDVIIQLSGVASYSAGEGVPAGGENVTASTRGGAEQPHRKGKRRKSICDFAPAGS